MGQLILFHTPAAVAMPPAIAADVLAPWEADDREDLQPPVAVRTTATTPSEPSAPFVRQSPESRKAAREIEPLRSRLRREVLRCIAAADGRGLTDEEIATTLGMPQNTARPRRIELVAATLVADSGRRRPTASGCAAAVWVLSHFVRNATSAEGKPWS